jgi:hypothetical protein
LIRFCRSLLLLCLASAALAQVPVRIAAPADGSELPADRMLRWEPAAGATSYDIVVCTYAACANIVTRAYGVTRTEWQVPALTAGTYFWRVVPIAANDLHLPASATTSFRIVPFVSGRIVEDLDGDGSRLLPLGGVRVSILRDTGDAPVATVTTDSDGRYDFHPAAGTWRLQIDEKSIMPTSGATSGAAIVPDQTFGPAGSMCATADGKMAVRSTPGPCFGGAAIAGPPRYMARIEYDGGSLGNVDFGFSYNLVTNLADADPAPRGSLRQFVVNANALHGVNIMRFVPFVAPTTVIQTHGNDERWWTITLAKPLPALTSDGTKIDGVAHDTTAHLVSVGRDRHDSADIDPDRVDLEIVTPAPIRVESKSTLHSLAVSGSSPIIAVKGDGAIDHVIAGAHPNHDFTGMARPEVAVAIESGSLNIAHSFVANARVSGIDVPAGTKLTADAVEVAGCGNAETTTGSGIHLAATEAQITRAFLHNNAGAGLQIDGSRNRVQQSNLTDNAFGVLFGPHADDNVITSSELVWNRGGALVADLTGATRPARNRFTQNYFNENGGVPIQLTNNEKGSMIGELPCGGPVVPAPRIETIEVRGTVEAHDRRAFIHGAACAGTTVELYTSFVTTELREHVRDMRGRDLPSIREALNRKDSVESRDPKMSDRLALPSVGEFHFSLTTSAHADGTFDAEVPLVNEFALYDRIASDPEAAKRMYGHISVAAIAIDPVGSTSEFGARKLVQ